MVVALPISEDTGTPPVYCSRRACHLLLAALVILFLTNPTRRGATITVGGSLGNASAHSHLGPSLQTAGNDCARAGLQTQGD
jgi:hypothetical protein